MATAFSSLMPREARRLLLGLPWLEWIAPAILGLACAIVLFSQDDRTAGRVRPSCKSNLKNIGIALFAYHEDYGCFPPAFSVNADGRPMHSWRALLVPYLRDVWQSEADWLDAHHSGRAAAAWVKARQLDDFLAAYDFSEPWDGPNNIRLATLRADAFRCPNNKTGASANTNYVAIVGRETAWPGQRSTRFTDIRDGTSNTVIVVEIRHSTIAWIEPYDLLFADARMESGDESPNSIGDPFREGANALLADGSVQYLRKSMPPETLKSLFTINGGEKTGDF